MKHINTNLIVLFLPIFAFAIALIILRLFSYSNRIDYKTETFSEGTEPLKNPYCGFYHIICYTLSDDYTPSDNIYCVIDSYSEPLALIEINLKNYPASVISEKGLEQLNDILAAWKKSPNSTKLILRFLYDWDGAALATEPDSVEIILKHMEQISKSVNRYRDSVYIMQGVFIGNWGEMHHSKFQDDDSLKQLINKLNNVIDPSIYLSLRTPKQWRTVNCSYQLKNDTRIGLFNDGILGSESDLGTYAENEREIELEFQNQLCRYVPNGGEVVYNNNLSKLDTAVSAFKKMHISYLNADYDNRVFEEFKSSVWQGDDAFNGCDGFSYIKAHLGYRYSIDSFRIKRSGLLNTDYTLCLTVKNSGFSNTLKSFKSTITLINEETANYVAIPISADFKSIGSGNKKTFTARLPVKELKQGDYLIYFSVNDVSNGQAIILGNKNKITENGYLLGRLKK